MTHEALYPPQMTTTVEEGKVTLVLDNGVRVVCCGNDDFQAGEDVHVYDKHGRELGFWSSDEWRDEPVLVMGAIMRCAGMGHPVLILHEDDECPNCKSGTLERRGKKELACRGECGEIFQS